MKTWKINLEETKKHYIDWWNHKGIVLNMWEHFQDGVAPHADVPSPVPPRDLNQKWFDPQWRAAYLDWYVAHSSLKADMLPVANTQLGPGSLAAILGGVFEGGEDTIWIHPNPNFTDDLKFDSNHPNWLLHKELLKACKDKAAGRYYVGMPDLMEGLDVLAALKGTDKVLLDTVMQPDVLEHQMQQINDIYFQVFDELYDIIREGDEMAFCYFSSWAPGKMTKLQSDISTMISVEDYRRFVQPFIRQQCQKIDYTLYHLDGVGALHHLPALLEVEELNAIQWTPGVGEPQGGSSKWYDLYRRILAAGKSIMACWVKIDELKPLLDAVGADGIHLEMDFHNEKEVEQALKIVEEYRTPTERNVKDEVESIRLQSSSEVDWEMYEWKAGKEVVIGTFCDATLSPVFCEMIRKKDYGGAIAMARKQVERGARMLRICVDNPCWNAREEMVALVTRLVADSFMADIPLIIHSVSAEVMEAGLRCVQGHCGAVSVDVQKSPKMNDDIFEAIVSGKAEQAVEATRRAIETGISPQTIINEQMIRAMAEVGQRFQEGKAFVPQLLMAGRAMKSALELLKPLMNDASSVSVGKVVIGTVKGDLHDIGKNLVASMLEGCGFEVVNVGIDVDCNAFVDAVKEHRADILCMSALLTTTMTYMKEVIAALDKAGIRQQVKVMVGGAPVSQAFADEIGADGYSDNANSAVSVAKQLMQRN